MTKHNGNPDILIIGSGMGGASMANALSGSGLKVQILERGDYIPRDHRNWDPEEVFHKGIYRSGERWIDRNGRPFEPNQHYCVGGSTKMYGACLMRFRPQDFQAVEHYEGISPAWPIDYETLEPWYARAEAMLGLRGLAGADPSEGARSVPYPHLPIAHDPLIESLKGRWERSGLHPFPLPSSVQSAPAGGCIRCRTCDGFPCQIDAKGDAENRALRPALTDPDITLETNVEVLRLLTTPDGRTIDGVEVRRNGASEIRRAGIVVLAAGAINSALLMQNSANSAHPDGLANRSGQLGRNYMAHHLTAMMFVGPRRNPTIYQKSLSINDYYWGDDEFKWPMGNIQMLGKLQAGMLTAEVPFVPNFVMTEIAARSVDMLAMSEDLPDPDNRVFSDKGRVNLIWQPNNRIPNTRLAKTLARHMRQAGYPVALKKHGGIETTSHQCGTVKMGTDPGTSVLDPLCKTWEIDNLYVVDGGFFVSSAAVNPALTIAAQALRVGDHIRAAIGRKQGSGQFPPG